MRGARGRESRHCGPCVDTARPKYIVAYSILERRERERDADEIEICIRRGAADSADRISRPTAAYVDNKLSNSSIGGF